MMRIVAASYGGAHSGVCADIHVAVEHLGAKGTAGLVSSRVTWPAQVAFKVDQVAAPEQALVLLTKGPFTAAFPAKASKGVLQATVTSAAVAKQVGKVGGEFALTLVVGDSGMAEDLQWTLGRVEVLHAPREDGSQPEGPAGLAVDTSLQPRTPIKHMHRYDHVWRVVT